MKEIILLLLPCNPAARKGNYFAGRSWEVIRNIYKRARIDLKKVLFAAVDSIITFRDPANDKETLGAIVLGTPIEMRRVANHDLHPAWEFFEKNNFENLRIHAYYVEIGLRRVFRNYKIKYLIAILNVRAYRLATYKALINIGDGDLPPNTFFFDCPDSPAWLFHCAKESIKLLRKCLLGEVRGGCIVTTSKIREYIRRVGRPRNIPEEFAYWRKNHKEILLENIDP